MNIILIIISSIVFLIGLFLFNLNNRLNKKLSENYTITGTIISYKRIWKYLYPIIEFTENNEKKIINGGGTINYKPINIGNEVKILKKDNGKYLTDSDIKHIKYYAISFILASILLFFISFNI